jgi:hypothetical protein
MSANDTQTLNGLFKQTYASEKKKLVPEGRILMNKLKFLERARQPGEAFNQPVVLN